MLAATGGGASGGVASAGGWMDTLELVAEPPAETGVGWTDSLEPPLETGRVEVPAGH